MSHEKLTELCSIYALGALDGEELREFEAHLKSGCTVCGEQILEYTQTVAAIPEALPNVRPSQDLKSRMMSRLEQEFPNRSLVDFKSAAQAAGAKRGRKISWLPWACAVAAGIALTVSLGQLSTLNRGLAEQQQRLNQQLEQLKVFQRLLSDEKEI